MGWQDDLPEMSEDDLRRISQRQVRGMLEGDIPILSERLAGEPDVPANPDTTEGTW